MTPAKASTVLTDDAVESDAERAEPKPGALLEELLREDATSSASPTRSAEPTAPRGGSALRTARLVEFEGRSGKIAWRGSSALVVAELAEEVEREVIDDALAQRDLVLVEVAEGETPVIVGVLQTRRPREIHLKAATVHIEGEREVLLRSGRGEVRIREDGGIEILGGHISAASRGLFQLVGRILKLN